MVFSLSETLNHLQELTVSIKYETEVFWIVEMKRKKERNRCVFFGGFSVGFNAIRMHSELMAQNFF